MQFSKRVRNNPFSYVRSLGLKSCCACVVGARFEVFALVLLATLSVSWLVVPASAGAGPIAQTQKAIADLSAALNRQEQRSEISANEYDADEANLASINANIVHLKSMRKETRPDQGHDEQARDRRGARLRPWRVERPDHLAFNQNVTRSDARPSTRTKPSAISMC